MSIFSKNPFPGREMYLFRMRQFEESTFSQHKLIHFLITRGLRALVMYGNESTCAEKKLIPQIASSGKDTFQYGSL